MPISFNNRTGTYEANKGIRDKKKHSYDARVQQSNEHFQDVQGYGSDLYKSKEARRSRLNSAKFLKELAHKSMIQNPTGIFLPNLEEVESFLEDDDAEIIKESSLEESESIIAERNKERWLLLKKISYMQRSAAKEKDQRDEELKKRAKAGLGKFNATSTTNTKVQNGGAGMPHEKLSGEIIENGQNASPAANTSANGNTPPSSQGSNGNRSESSGSQSNGADTINGTSTTDEQAIGMLGADPSFPNDHSTEDVPIVSLDEQGVVDLILSVNPKQYDNFSTFVDPYGFEDPLVDDFYEDLWYEHARRNTEIYRMIFHTQPDDCVPTWKDYKRFSKLQSAFMFAQKQEAKYRQSKTSTEFDDTLSDISSEKSKENEFKYHQRNVSAVKMQDLDQVGLLGQPPQSGGNDPETSSKKKFIRRFSTKDALRDGEDARRGGGEEEEEEETGSGDEEGGAENDTHAGENIVVDGEILPSRKEGSPQSEDSEPKPNEEKGYTKRKAVRRRAGTFSARRKALSGDRVYDRNTAERILTEIQGNLVFFPADWLMNELEGGNWFYNTDRIPPIEIYD